MTWTNEEVAASAPTVAIVDERGETISTVSLISRLCGGMLEFVFLVADSPLISRLCGGMRDDK